MSLGLVDVDLYAIDKVNIRTLEGKRKLQREIYKSKTRIPFPVYVKKINLDKNIVPFYYFPWGSSQTRRASVIKYKIVHKTPNPQTGKLDVYGYVISISK